MSQRRKQREQKIDNCMQTAAHSVNTALKLYRRAPESTNFSHFARMMFRALKDDLEYIERVAKGQRLEE